MCQKIVDDEVTFFTKTQSYSPQNSTKRHRRCHDQSVLKYLHRNFGKYAEKRI